MTAARAYKVFLAIVAIAILSTCMAPVVLAEDVGPVAEEEQAQVEEQVRPRHSWGHRILTYIPNRVVDLIDIFRLRLRVGPGVAVNIRATERANLYAGIYHTAYVGLPGPRGGPRLRSPVGLEQERGIELMGVDATDDMKHEPGYSASELDIGVHLLIVGGEAGFDPVEVGDFFAGFLFFDPMRDDF